MTGEGAGGYCKKGTLPRYGHGKPYTGQLKDKTDSIALRQTESHMFLQQIKIFPGQGGVYLRFTSPCRRIMHDTNNYKINFMFNYTK